MPEVKTEPTLVTAERELAKPVTRATITKVSLPAEVPWHVMLGGREYQVRRPLEDIPLAVREFMLTIGAEDAAKLLGE